MSSVDTDQQLKRRAMGVGRPAPRQRLHAQGTPLAEIDERLVNACTTMHKVAVALFGDSRQPAQVTPP